MLNDEMMQFLSVESLEDNSKKCAYQLYLAMRGTTRSIDLLTEIEVYLDFTQFLKVQKAKTQFKRMRNKQREEYALVVARSASFKAPSPDDLGNMLAHVRKLEQIIASAQRLKAVIKLTTEVIKLWRDLKVKEIKDAAENFLSETYKQFI